MKVRWISQTLSVTAIYYGLRFRFPSMHRLLVAASCPNVPVPHGQNLLTPCARVPARPYSVTAQWPDKSRTQAWPFILTTTMHGSYLSTVLGNSFFVNVCVHNVDYYSIATSRIKSTHFIIAIDAYTKCPLKCRSVCYYSSSIWTDSYFNKVNTFENGFARNEILENAKQQHLLRSVKYRFQLETIELC